MGEELTPATVDAMEAWLKTNNEERGQAGEHRYRAEDFGLDPDQLAERFAYYGARFPIANPR